MTINIRATDNWQSAKTKIKSYQALTRKNHGKSHIPTSTKNLLKKVDEIVDNLSQDHRDFAQYQDIIESLERQGTKLNDEEEDIVIKHLRDKYEIY
jgi:regulator of sigma D